VTTADGRIVGNLSITFARPWGARALIPTTKTILEQAEQQ
jgi:hypothetical protein